MSQTEILMPSMGEGVIEATLVKWLKKPGDHVEQDEPLMEVSTDKVDTEIPAPASGFIISLYAEEGATVAVDQLLAVIDSQQSGAAQATKAPAAAKKPSAPEPTKSSPPSSSTHQKPKKANSKDTAPKKDPEAPVKSSPLVRKIAKEKGIDLANVQGSGLNGRITRRDLDVYLKDLSRSAATTYAAGSDRRPRQESDAQPQEPMESKPQPQATQAPVPVQEPKGLATTMEDGREYLDGVEVTREKMSKMRSLIAHHMVESVTTSPHVTTVFEVDLTKVVKMRNQYKSQVAEKEGIKLTFTPFLIHAAVQAIKKHPIVNTSVDGDTILFKKDINMGCAVALENGLIVPVIKQAQDLNLLGIVRRLDDLVTRARTKKLKPDDVKGGTFSITNPGGFGSITSNPIINQPQVAILGIGAIVKRPVVIDDAIAIRDMMMISLTFDHRVVDGEGGAKYLADLKAILENYSDTPE